MNKQRWNPYLMFKGGKTKCFWMDHFGKNDHKLLFILGKGFDVRMNLCLENLIESCPEIDIQILLIYFNEGQNSSSNNLEDIVKDNYSKFNKITTNKKKVIKKRVDMWEGKGRNKRRVGDRKAADAFNYDEIEKYSDIIVDISSLPKGIYFSLIGKLLSLLDSVESNGKNLFITVCENAELDSLIQKTDPEDDLAYVHGFGGSIELESEKEKPLIWLPILGEGKQSQILKGVDKITEDKSRLYEICPILPFPSNDIRRSDSILIEYHELLFDNLDIESQNIMFVAERNPFQVYIQLSKTVHNYRNSLNILNGCKVALSTFSSKLLSIGTLLVAYENKDFVGILNVNNQRYVISNENEFKNLKDNSELFVTWIAGNPYQNK